jgi:hypothetical protein
MAGISLSFETKWFFLSGIRVQAKLEPVYADEKLRLRRYHLSRGGAPDQ